MPGSLPADVDDVLLRPLVAVAFVLAVSLVLRLALAVRCGRLLITVWSGLAGARCCCCSPSTSR